jgi:hypothetical protein
MVNNMENFKYVIPLFYPFPIFVFLLQNYD